MLTTVLSGGLIGLIFGFILQRTRFCLTGGFRDMYIEETHFVFFVLFLPLRVLLCSSITGVIVIVS